LDGFYKIYLQYIFKFTCPTEEMPMLTADPRTEDHSTAGL